MRWLKWFFIRLPVWVFSALWTLIVSLPHGIAETAVFVARYVIIATIFAIAAMLVVQYAYQLHNEGSVGYEYKSYIEGKVGVLQGKTKALLVRFDVAGLDQVAFLQTRAFLTPEQVLQLEKLPTLKFTKTAPGCYHIEELQVTTKRI